MNMLMLNVNVSSNVIVCIEFSSTPSADEKLNPDFDSLSPIKMEVGDGESRAYSNPSSRGHSPRRMSATVERGNKTTDLTYN